MLVVSVDAWILNRSAFSTGKESSRVGERTKTGPLVGPDLVEAVVGQPNNVVE